MASKTYLSLYVHVPLIGVGTLPITRIRSIPQSAYLWSFTEGCTEEKKQFQGSVPSLKQVTKHENIRELHKFYLVLKAPQLYG